MGFLDDKYGGMDLRTLLTLIEMNTMIEERVEYGTEEFDSMRLRHLLEERKATAYVLRHVIGDEREEAW